MTSTRADIAYPAIRSVGVPASSRRLRGLRDQVEPHVVVLFGATGDLSRRKLLPGLTYLALSSLVPDMQVVGCSMDDMDDDAFRAFARESVEKYGTRELTDEQWDSFMQRLHYVPTSAGPEALAKAVHQSRQQLGEDTRLLHYLSVPPKAATAVIRTLNEAKLVKRARVVM